MGRLRMPDYTGTGGCSRPPDPEILHTVGTSPSRQTHSAAGSMLLSLRIASRFSPTQKPRSEQRVLPETDQGPPPHRFFQRKLADGAGCNRYR